MNEVRDGLLDSGKETASNIPISTTRSLIQKLAKCLRKDVTIAVDGLDECVEYVSEFLDEMKTLARTDSGIRVLVSSRNSPGSMDVPRILIDKSKTENGIRAFVAARMKSENIDAKWAVEEIVRKSEGRFRFAIMVTEGLQSSAAGVRSLKSRMKDLPNSMNDVYLQTFRHLEKESQAVLVTVLRWLICRGDRIELQPIADELAQKYSPEETSDNDDSEFPSLLKVAKSLTEIGRDFIKVSSNVVQLDHNSVRDFVKSWGEDITTARKTCSECGRVDAIDILSQISGKEAKLIMAEYMVRTINSGTFQEEFILLEDHKSSSKSRGSKKPSTSKRSPMRYEAADWYKHLREAEAAWTTHERESEPRWNALYELAERFLSPNSQVYQDWLTRKNDIKDKVKMHDPPLYTVARYGLEGLIQRYLDQGCDVNTRNRNQYTTSTNLRKWRRVLWSAGLTILLERGAGVNEMNDKQTTPLLTAFQYMSSKGVTRPIRNLLDYGADPDITDKWQQSCLHYAAQAHNIDACDELLPEAKPEVSRRRVNLEDLHGETPLHWACKSNAPKSLIELLLQRGADLTVRDKEQQTPLYEACRVGNEAVVRLFLENGADIHDKDFKGDTALHEAVYSGNRNLVELLTTRKYGAKIDELNESSQNSLALAASRNEWEILFFLIDRHKKKKGNMGILSQPDSRGDTPLSLAVAAKNLVAVQKLLDKKSVGDEVARRMCQPIDLDNNGQNSGIIGNNNQPLHKAASSGCAEICRLLIDRGAPIDEEGKANEYGSLPLDAAFKGWQEWNGDDASRLQEFEETVNVLLSKSSQVAGKTRKLICATWRGSVSVCQQLEALMNRTDEHGWLRAAIGVSYGKGEVAKIMCSDGDKSFIDQLLSGQIPSEPHGQKPSKWSSQNKHDAVRLSAKDMVASFISCDDDPFKEAAVVANHPVPAGLSRFYYEVKIEKLDGGEDKTAKVGVGFCTDLAYYNSVPGSRAAKAPSWGLHGDTGKLSTRFDSGHRYKDKSGSSNIKTFGVGDTVGCGIDIPMGLGPAKIFYTLNGKDLGVAFVGVNGRLFPTVGAKSARWKIEVNFGEEPFKWKDAKKE